MDPGLLFLAAVFAIVSEYVDSSLGMGYGTSLTPLLLLLGFDPLDVVPAVLLSEVVTGLIAAALHQAAGNVSFAPGSTARKAVWVLAGFGGLGSIIGVQVAVRLSPDVLRAYIGVIVLATGILVFFANHMRLRFSWRRLMVVGLVGAFNKGIAGGGYGAVITGGQVLSGLNAKAAIGVTSLTQGFVSLVGAVSYFAHRGSLSTALALAIILGAVASTPLSAMTVRKLKLPHLRLAVGLASCVLGALTLAQVAEA